MALALVVVEEDARRTVHLRDDDALGSVDDEGAVRRHERHVAHVDVLLLDILDGLRLRLRVDVEHDEAQRHLERGGVGHAALAALVEVVFGLLVFVLHEFEMRGVGEVLDGKHRLEHRLQAFGRTAALRRVHQEELLVGRLLHLDQVRHLADFPDVPEDLANALAAGECLRHVVPQCSRARTAIGGIAPGLSGRRKRPRMSSASRPAPAAARARKRAEIRPPQKRRNGPGATRPGTVPFSWIAGPRGTRALLT